MNLIAFSDPSNWVSMQYTALSGTMHVTLAIGHLGGRQNKITQNLTTFRFNFSQLIVYLALS